MTFKRFNQTAKCPKCRSKDIGAVYVPAGVDRGGRGCWAFGRNLDYPQFREHIVRTCARCLYRWFEAPLDETQGSIS